MTEPTTAASVPAEGTWNQVLAEDAAQSIDRMTTAAPGARNLRVIQEPCSTCRGSGYSNEGIGRSPVAYRPCRECRGSGLSRPDPIAPGPGREAATEVCAVCGFRSGVKRLGLGPSICDSCWRKIDRR